MEKIYNYKVITIPKNKKFLNIITYAVSVQIS